MNTKAFQAQKFATNHYLRLLKVRPAIDNSPSKRNQVPYSSRNLTHMTRYQHDLKTKKLVNKLIEINNSNYDQNYFQRKRSSKKSRLSTKNRKLTFSQNKSYQERQKTLVNPFKMKEKRMKVHQLNVNLMWKLSRPKSDYQDAFSKDRQKSLQNYSHILKKSRKEDEIRDVFFQTYEKVKQQTIFAKTTLRSRSKKSKKHQSKITEITRPQTAK